MQTEYSIKFLEDATETLRAVAHPIRLLMIELMYAKGSLTVKEIYETLEIDQAVASHHLRILKDKDVLELRRDGRNAYYSLAKDDYYLIFSGIKKALLAESE
ncbi:MAG: ArsR/SmtB family transcription factor [Saprospiraceae bacterium]